MELVCDSFHDLVLTLVKEVYFLNCFDCVEAVELLQKLSLDIHTKTLDILEPCISRCKIL